jgi:hypothetical protein
MLEEPVDGRVEVSDPTEPERLVRAGHWPGLGSIAGEGGAVEVEEVHRVAVLLLAPVGQWVAAAQALARRGHVARTKVALCAAEAVFLVVTPPPAYTRAPRVRERDRERQRERERERERESDPVC